MDPDKEDWWDTTQAAAHMKIARKTLYKWLSEEKIRFAKPPGTRQFLFKQCWLDAFLNGGGAEPEG